MDFVQRIIGDRYPSGTAAQGGRIFASLKCEPPRFLRGKVGVCVIDTREVAPSHSDKKDNSTTKVVLLSLVPVIGVEPIRYRYHWILSPARLPIPSHRRIKFRNVEIIAQVSGKINSF